jgi:hypothetical protein
MYTSTRTITINAALLRKIQGDNRRLRRLLKQADHTLGLSPGIEAPWVEAPRRAAQLLSELRDQLSMHFAMEEVFGYFEPNSVDRRLAEAYESLREEHVPLYMEICDIAERAERVVYGECSTHELKRIALHFRAFLDQLLAHESREIELILQAMDLRKAA